MFCPVLRMDRRPNLGNSLPSPNVAGDSLLISPRLLRDRAAYATSSDESATSGTERSYYGSLGNRQLFPGSYDQGFARSLSGRSRVCRPAPRAAVASARGRHFATGAVGGAAESAVVFRSAADVISGEFPVTESGIFRIGHEAAPPINQRLFQVAGDQGAAAGRTRSGRARALAAGGVSRLGVGVRPAG